jgi:serine/threonine protein kinase
MFRPGDQIGPYTLVNKLGKGAFGVVWLAERRTQITTTTAAIKIPFDEDIDIEKIKNEADVWVRASGHPNVLPIIEADIYGEHIIIASAA